MICIPWARMARPVRTILPIGRKKSRRGFTLIEVMIAVSILALATIMIYQSNLLSLSVYNRYLHRMVIQNWAEEKLWEAKQTVLESESSPVGETSGDIQKGHDHFHWALNIQEGDIELLYNINLKIMWKEEGREASLYRLGYVSKEKTGAAA